MVFSYLLIAIGLTGFAVILPNFIQSHKDLKALELESKKIELEMLYSKRS